MEASPPDLAKAASFLDAHVKLDSVLEVCRRVRGLSNNLLSVLRAADLAVPPPPVLPVFPTTPADKIQKV